MRVLQQAIGKDYALYGGDSVEILAGLPDESVHLTVTSPPFASLYTYNPSERDVGNSRTPEEFWQHFGYIIDNLLRLTKPGRNACIHVAQVPAMLERDGYIGIKDFRGQTVLAFEKRGWVYHGDVCVDKDPQALRHGTPVLTPHGWVPIERLRFGDDVMGRNGQATAVVGVWPQGQRPIYRVAFSDGVVIDCDGAHKWTVYTHGGRRSGSVVTMTTDELMASGLRTPAGRRRYAVPLVAPVEFAPGPSFPLDPYLLGVLLGDGNMTQRASVSVTTDHEIVQSLVLPAGHHMRQQEGTSKGQGKVATYHAVSDTWHNNDVLNALRGLGLQGLRAWEKHIPPGYLFASVDERRALLRGLLDTDGQIKKNHSVRFASTSQRLAEDVASLVQSLGGVARCRRDGARTYTYQGASRQGRPQWEVVIALPGDWCPFTVGHKVQRWGGRRDVHREIVSIEPVGLDDATCITVAAEDGLYVTDGYVVTHNSQAIRTKSKALLFVQLRKDATWSRPALADYILIFRKPGQNTVPVHPDIDNNQWIEWARPVWYNVRESDTLQYTTARDGDDERHIAPLQLETIERCIRLWTNPGETVLDPFSGIASVPVVALRHGRRGIAVELKPSYLKVAARNLEEAEAALGQRTLFDGLVESAG